MLINLQKNLSTLTVSPADAILGPLMGELRFKRVNPLYGQAAVMAKTKVSLEETKLFEYDEGTDTLTTFAALLDRVYKLVVLHGHTPVLSEINKVKEYEPRLEAITGIDLRGAQAKMLATMCSCDYAQLNGITGMGKSVLITQICRIYPYDACRIVVCAQQRPVVTALRRGLEKYFPGDVGQVGGGSNTQRRITVATSKSLKKIDPEKISILLYDEVHTAAGKEVSSVLTRFCRSKMFGMSASTECRTDRADLLVEAIFGPVRVTVDMAEGQQEGYIPPVEAHFYELHMPEIRANTPTARKRDAVWRNRARNYAVASVARHWETNMPDPQILIMTDALEHVLFLKQQLPEYEIIYASCNTQQIEKFRELGILPDDFKPPTNKDRENKIRAFETGKLRKVISTTTLGVGVDAPGLDVFIRADGGSSEISNIQFRGRLMRGEQGIYCDFSIQGDKAEEGRSKKRLSSAKSAGWPITVSPVPYAEATL